MATLVGVAQDQDVYKENVALKNFGTQVCVSAKPLRWHNTLADMKVGLMKKAANDNMVCDALSEW